MRSIMVGSGIFIPPHRVPNERLALVMDTSDEWIRQRTGIEARHFAAPGVATSDLAVEASTRAIADAGVSKDDIDYIVFATMTPDRYFPGCSTILQHKLGMAPIPCLDIRQQCAGFLYGLQTTDALLRSGIAHRVLLVGAEVHGGFLPWSWDVLLGLSDRRVDKAEYDFCTRFRDRAVLFGDAAAAVVVTGTDDAGGRGLVDLVVRGDGSQWQKMRVDAGGSAYRPYFSPSMTEDGSTVPVVEGQEVFRAAVTLMPQAIMELLTRQGLALSDLALVIMHQANLRIIEAVRRKLELPEERVFNNIQRYGNTTAATIPLAYHEAKAAGRVHEGDLVCFVAVGAGLNWGAALYRA